MKLNATEGKCRQIETGSIRTMGPMRGDKSGERKRCVVTTVPYEWEIRTNF